MPRQFGSLVNVSACSLFKYGADPKSPDLYDSRADHCDLMDPDFVSNDQPVWSICGPYVRKNLEKGDVLFFLPQKSRLIKAGSRPEYICTGVLVKVPQRPKV